MSLATVNAVNFDNFSIYRRMFMYILVLHAIIDRELENHINEMFHSKHTCMVRSMTNPLFKLTLFVVYSSKKL